MFPKMAKEFFASWIIANVMSELSKGIVANIFSYETNARKYCIAMHWVILNDTLYGNFSIWF